MKTAGYGLTATALLLYLIGLLFVFETSAAEMLERGQLSGWHGPLFKQLGMGGASFFLGYLTTRMGFNFWLSKASFLMSVGCLSLLLVFFPWVGVSIKGAHRWLSLGFYELQPSEFVKALFPLYLLSLDKGERSFQAFSKLTLKAMVPVVLIWIEPDNGTALLLLALLFTFFFLSRFPWRYWLLPIFSVTLLGAILISQMPHVRDRLTSFASPEGDVRGRGHQPWQAKIAVGSGGLFGRGFGESLQKFRYLPEARSDYIASIIGEELGFVGLGGLILLFMGLIFFGAKIALQAKSESLSIAAMLLTLILAMGAFINLGVAIGILPSKGMNLPLISKGGSSLLATGTIIGLLCSIDGQNHSSRRENRRPSFSSSSPFSPFKRAGD